MTARFATLQEWLHWQETLHPSVMDLGLARIRQVAVVLFGDDFAAQQPLTITVAGTNGKGSCVTMLAVLLSSMGKRVGSFTSPHLFRYNERIRIDNQEVSDADLCTAFEAIDAARGDISLTYFEFNALAAFWLFRHHQVDVQVLEVGLGGRLDAVNLVDADIAVITNIALDHVEWLGDTREKIGAEKAGILREQGRLVYGETDMPESICDRIAELGVTFRQLGEEFSVGSAEDGRWFWWGMDVGGERVELLAAKPALPEPSVACALQVLAWLDLFDAERIRGVLPSLALSGRFEKVVFGDNTFLFDVAHNAAGAQFLADRLLQESERAVDVVFSAMSDKDIAGVMSALSPVVANWFVFPLANNVRAASLEQLHAAALQAGIESSAISCCVDAAAALQAVGASASTVLVCGSFFTVSEVKGLLDAS